MAPMVRDDNTLYKAFLKVPPDIFILELLPSSNKSQLVDTYMI